MEKKDIHNWKKIFKFSAEQSGVVLKDKEILLFEKYLFLLEEWNRKINITAIRNHEEVAIKHFLDSVLVLKYVSFSGKLADIGSGGGFPGIPLKIILPKQDIVLIEPLAKRVNFLRTVISSLNLENISVYKGRAEQFPEKEIFDFTISRALSDLKTFCRLSLPVLKPGGKMIAMKGKNTDAELSELMNEEERIHLVQKKTFKLPHNSGFRTLFFFEKCFT